MAPTPNVEALDRWAEELFDCAVESTRRRKNESALISDMDPLIRGALTDLYGFPADSYDVEMDTLPKGEGYSPVDRVYGGVLVEYEWKMGRARREHGSFQALTYLENVESTTGSDGSFTAVVTDGLQWGFLVDSPTSTPNLFDEPDRTSASRYEWRENDIASCRRFLQLCGSKSKSPLTGRALANAFGPLNPSARQFVALLAVIFEGRAPGSRADTLYAEWSRSTEVAYGSLDSLADALARDFRDQFAIPAGSCRDLRDLLFVVQTYFALVARLVAIEVVAIALREPDSQPSTWVSMRDIEGKFVELDSGDIPRGVEAQNLFETDVFSWWLDSFDDEVERSVRQLLDILSTFAFPRVAFGAIAPTDNLRDLYQMLVPRDLRRRLGEFPTPIWLAEACVARLAGLGIDVEAGRVLDPCCGTGAFLIPILRSRVTKLRLQKGASVTAADVQKLLDGVAGFDINPVAVTAARANFLVALGSLAEVGQFSLPIWRADSIVLPDPTPAQGTLLEARLVGRSHLELRTSLPHSFPIPTALSSAKGVTDIRRLLERWIVEPDTHTAKSAFLSSVRAASELSDSDWRESEPVLEVLYERVRELADDGRDGIWARIIENSFAPLFVDKFDVVIGNPPWIGWSKLPTSWRQEAEGLWKRYGLWAVPRIVGDPQRRFSNSNDLAGLVFAVSLDRYAKSDGVVAFLTPDSILKSDPGSRAFRKFHLRSQDEDRESHGTDIPFALIHVDDWGDVSPFAPDAGNRPVFLVARSGEAQSFPVRTVSWSRAGAGVSLSPSWRHTEAHLRALPGCSFPVLAEFPFTKWAFWADGEEPVFGGTNEWDFGVGAHTRGANGIFYVLVDRPSLGAGTVRIKNDPSAGDNAAVITHQSVVEAAMVYPLLRGRDIRPWRAQPSRFTLMTQDPEDFGALLDEGSFRSRYPLAFAWLSRHKAQLRRRRPPMASWDTNGRDWYRMEGAFQHMQTSHLVVVPEQAKPPPAAVVGPGPVHPLLGRRAIPVPNHKVLFCAVPSREEALFLAGFINSSSLQRFLNAYVSATSVSPSDLRRLSIPPYDGSEDAHKNIVQMAKALDDSADPSVENDLNQALDEAVHRVLLEGGRALGSAPLRTPRGSRPRTRRGQSQEFAIAEPLF